MAARPAALMRRFFGAASVPLAFARRIFRALARALISLRRCAGDRRRFARFAGAGASANLATSALDSPAMASSCPSNDSICSLSAMTRRRSATERSVSDFIKEKDTCGFDGGQTMVLVTPRSSNRAIFAPIAPHPRQPVRSLQVAGAWTLVSLCRVCRVYVGLGSAIMGLCLVIKSG